MSEKRTVKKDLQEFCDLLLDDATGVTWDLYRHDQKDKLELKVRMALHQTPPSLEGVNFVASEVRWLCHLTSLFIDLFATFEWEILSLRA